MSWEHVLKYTSLRKRYITRYASLLKSDIRPLIGNSISKSFYNGVFIMTIPSDSTTPLQTRSSKQKSSQQTESSNPCEGTRLDILLIDSDDVTRTEITKMLTDCAHSVIGVTTVYEAWTQTEKRKQNPFDLILVDTKVDSKFQMMNIVTKIPFVYISASHSQALMSQSLDRGAKFFLMKPFDCLTLTNVCLFVDMQFKLIESRSTKRPEFGTTQVEMEKRPNKKQGRVTEPIESNLEKLKGKQVSGTKRSSTAAEIDKRVKTKDGPLSIREPSEKKAK